MKYNTIKSCDRNLICCLFTLIPPVEERLNHLCRQLESNHEN
ncbi:hypothetical protein VKI22_00230 [Cyanobacterium aponinum UTEX 3221]|nr:hypothetical protein [Cyanobacterium aponinum]WRL38564.1 hypothetical protein VKI22_00230 [Cyanobacterium aponinum UTEX 3221]